MSTTEPGLSADSFFSCGTSCSAAKRLDDEDAGRPQRGRKSTDRRAYLRFAECVNAQGLSRILKADLHADRFSFDIDQQALRDAEALDGTLMLVTNTDLPAADAIDRYKALADIERGFRVLKQDIDIAPVHHRLPDRIRAHALICFLALVLHRILRSRMRATGSTLSPSRALALLRQVQHIDLSINQQPAVRSSVITPEQRDLFAQMRLLAPTQHTIS